MTLRATTQPAGSAIGQTILNAVDAAAVRSTIGTVIGVDVQPYAANLAGAYGQKLLAYKIGAALNSTSDQALTMIGAATKYIITSIIFTNASATPILAAGTIYSAASKGGIALFGSAVTTYTGLTATTKFVSQTLVAALTTDVLTAATLYFSLTTANAAGATVDIYIFGQDLS